MKVALLVNAATELGVCVARELENKGFHVVLTTRRESTFNLAHALHKSPNHWIYTLNEGDPTERCQLVCKVERELHRLDAIVLIPTALYRAPLELAYEFELKEQLSLNLCGPLELIKLALPLLRKASNPKIVAAIPIVSLPAPMLGMYGASIAALENALLTLRQEISPWGIQVSTIYSGPVESKDYSGSRIGLALQRDINAIKEQYIRRDHHNTGPLSWFQSPEHGPIVASRIAKTLESTQAPASVLATSSAMFINALQRMTPPFLYNFMIDRLWNASGGGSRDWKARSSRVRALISFSK